MDVLAVSGVNAVVEAAGAAGAAGADDASRLRKAVTSLVVVTMLITVQPSADLVVRVAARAAGSFAEALVVENSCIGRTVSRTQPARTSCLTSVAEGGPSYTNSPSRSASRR